MQDGLFNAADQWLLATRKVADLERQKAEIDRKIVEAMGQVRALEQSLKERVGANLPERFVMTTSGEAFHVTKDRVRRIEIDRPDPDRAC